MNKYKQNIYYKYKHDIYNVPNPVCNMFYILPY